MFFKDVTEALLFLVIQSSFSSWSFKVHFHLGHSKYIFTLVIQSSFSPWSFKVKGTLRKLNMKLQTIHTPLQQRFFYS